MRLFGKRKRISELATKSDDDLVAELHELDRQKQAIREQMLEINAEQTKRVQEQNLDRGMELRL